MQLRLLREELLCGGFDGCEAGEVEVEGFNRSGWEVRFEFGYCGVRFRGVADCYVDFCALF